MSRPRGFADLAGHTVGVWGVGVEGAATRNVLEQIGATVVAVDDAVAGGDGGEGGVRASCVRDVIFGC